MSECFLGEIRMFGGNYAPENWHLCDGSFLPVQQYQALFSLIGTTYGGDGRTTFAVPDLRGRLPVGMGQGPGLSNQVLGTKAGTETVTLSVAQLPAHTHVMQASTDVAKQATASPDLLAATVPSGFAAFLPPTATGNVSRSFDDTTIGYAGGTGPHSNMMGSLAINFIIALEGTFPERPR